MKPTLKDAALEYASYGYRVFPLVPGLKIPPKGSNGCLDATTDIDTIFDWWEAEPLANIGLSTDGLAVIDVDGTENLWLAGQTKKMLDLSVAPMSRTPGGGTHRIFREPEGKRWKNSQSELAPKVDVRANGGYIVAPPSVIGDKGYHWQSDSGITVEPSGLDEPPDWLAKMLDKTAKGSTPSARATTPTDSNQIPDGQRNGALAKLGGLMRYGGMGESEIMAGLSETNRTRCVPPMDVAEVAKIAHSVSRYEPDQISTILIEGNLVEFGEQPEPSNEIQAPGSFPGHLLHVPGLISDVMKHNEAGAFRPQPVLALGAAISLMGVLAGRKITDSMGTRTNVYCLGVCGSGGGKERARQVSKELLHEAGLESMVAPEGVASHAGLISAVSHNPALLFQLDEIGRMLKTVANPSASPHLFKIIDVLLKLFSSSNSIYLGDAYADTKMNKKIVQPCACLYGTTVPESLYESLTEDSLTNGFLGRILIFESTDHDPKPDRSRKISTQSAPPSLVQAVRSWGEFQPGHGNLAGEFPDPMVVPYSQEASDAIDQIEDEAWQTRNDSESAAVKAMFARVVEKTRKLALIWACSESMEEPSVGIEGVRWGADLSRYITLRMLHESHFWMAETPHGRRRQSILRMARQKGGSVSGTILVRSTRDMTKKERDDAVASLVETGDLLVSHEESPNGRGTTVYSVA